MARQAERGDWRESVTYLFAPKPRPRWYPIDDERYGRLMHTNGDWAMFTVGADGVILRNAFQKRTIRAAGSRYEALAAVRIPLGFTILNDGTALITKAFPDKTPKPSITGGVTVVALRDGQSGRISTEDGLAQRHCMGIATDGKLAWVSHTREQFGLTRIDLAGRVCTKFAQSKNGLPIGGQQLLYAQNYLWIDQHNDLLRYNVESGRAKKFLMRDVFEYSRISGMVATEDGDIWVTASGDARDRNTPVDSSGLIRIRRQN